MKLSCLQENLNKGLNVVSRLVSTRGTLEILSHILIKTEDGRLKLSATNLEIGVNYKLGAKIEKDGAITVPARLASDLVSQLPSGKIDLQVKEDTFYLKTGHFASEIKGLSADEFPLIPRVKEKKIFSIQGGVLKEAINMVSFASAPDDARPVLAGIYLKTKKNKIHLVATDSYRLAEKIVEIKGENIPEKEAIIPARSLMELSRMLDNPEVMVDVYLDDTQVMFETDEIEFTSRLVEGKFPDYKQIIPDGYETKALFEKTEFANIIKVVALFSKESAGSVTLGFKSKGELEATSAGSQYGGSNASCDAKIEGKDAEIVFNSKYLLDVVSSLEDGTLSIEISGKLNPGVLRKEGDNSYLYVIMPLRA